MRVVVAGGGIGGLTLALALRARGIRCVIVERAAALGEAGAGIQLGPNAVKALDVLGVGEALRAVAVRAEAAELREARGGRLLLGLPLGAAAEHRWRAPYVLLRRADLQTVLLDAVRARGGTELRLDAEVAGAEASGRLDLVGGAAIEGEVVVGADGLRSVVADTLFGPSPPRFTGQTAWRATIPTEVLPAPLAPKASVWNGGGRHLVAYPVRGGREVNLVAVTEARHWRVEGWSTPGDPDDLARAFSGWPEPVPALLAAVRETWRWALFDRPPRPRWTRGRATLLGDAAHPMPPFLAQGAAAAIEDAVVLAATLAGADDPAAALRAYEALRRPRTTRMQRASQHNATLFHLPPPLARAVFGVAAAVAPGEAAMARFDWLYGWSPPV